LKDKESVRLAIIGNPLSHSLSPVLHEFLLQELGMDGNYLAHEIYEEALGATLQDFEENGVTGFNVTIPFKQRIMQSLDVVEHAARVIGAVNTVRCQDDKLFGYNTDGIGFVRSLTNKGVQIGNRSAVVLGAGGAARAVVFGLIQQRVEKISVCNRTLSRAEALVREMRATTGFEAIAACAIQERDVLASLVEDSILVNTTSLGMWPDTRALPFEIRSEAAKMIVVDLVYNPLETRFLQLARQMGATAIDGLDMFIFQGLAALQIWLQRPVKIKHEIIRTFLIGKLENYGTH